MNTGIDFLAENLLGALDRQCGDLLAGVIDRHLRDRVGDARRLVATDRVSSIDDFALAQVVATREQAEGDPVHPGQRVRASLAHDATDAAVEDFERILKVNTTSVFALCQAALPHLIKSKGNIVNTASTAALQGIAYTVAYAASKHGVAAITKSLAIEFAHHGVRINAICPGHVNTPMGNAPPPPGDVDWSLVMRNAPKLENGSCDPEDVAALFAYLASDEARKITGSLFTIDGGQLAG